MTKDDINVFSIAAVRYGCSNDSFMGRLLVNALIRNRSKIRNDILRQLIIEISKSILKMDNDIKKHMWQEVANRFEEELNDE